MTRYQKSLTLMLSAVISLAVSCGCDQASSGLVSATGTVTFDGQPLSSGTVTLYQQNAAAGSGEIANGVCHIHQSTSTRGVAPGRYQVAVQCWAIEPHSVQPDGSIGGPGQSLVPENYTSAQTSGLSVDITNESPDFELILVSE